MADQKDNEIKRGYSGLQDGEVITQLGGKKKGRPNDDKPEFSI